MSFTKLAKDIYPKLDLDPSRNSPDEIEILLMTSIYNTGLVTPVEFSAALNLMKELTRLSEATNEVFQDFDRDPRFAAVSEALAAATGKLKEARAEVKKLTEKYCEENRR